MQQRYGLQERLRATLTQTTSSHAGVGDTNGTVSKPVGHLGISYLYLGREQDTLPRAVGCTVGGTLPTYQTATHVPADGAAGQAPYHFPGGVKEWIGRRGKRVSRGSFPLPEHPAR